MDKNYCVFSCGFCKKGKQHICYKCGEINSHRSSNCPSEQQNDIPCIFNCGFPSCKKGNPHVCKICGEKNVHRSSDCPKDSCKVIKTQNPTKFIGKSVSAPVPTPVSAHVSTPVYAKSMKIGSETGVRRMTADIIRSSNKRASTLSVFVRYNGKIYLLISFRVGKNGRPGLVTTGGLVDPNEDSLDCAIRECREEHGLNVSESEIIKSRETSTGGFMHYFAFLENFRLDMVRGPMRGFEHEIIQGIDVRTFKTYKIIAFCIKMHNFI
jgi:8-oxo-dGTP pyrophosphatase MutT (NUDIX family)